MNIKGFSGNWQYAILYIDTTRFAKQKQTSYEKLFAASTKYIRNKIEEAFRFQNNIININI
jgi:hypothetical protein